MTENVPRAAANSKHLKGTIYSHVYLQFEINKNPQSDEPSHAPKGEQKMF